MLGLVAAMRGRRTVIFSSHILADVQRIADQVGILRAGRLLYQGTRDLTDTYLQPSRLIRIAGDVVATWRPRASGRILTIQVEAWTPLKRRARSALLEQAVRLAAHRGFTLDAVRGA
jgi:ABC-type multidrug transport system ATPase subunit